MCAQAKYRYIPIVFHLRTSYFLPLSHIFATYLDAQGTNSTYVLAKLQPFTVLYRLNAGSDIEIENHRCKPESKLST